MALISSIKLDISNKLEKDRDFRKYFFRSQTEDEIAISIRSLREKRKKRQIDLAIEAKMRQSAISRIEQADYGGWSLKTLFRVADALDARVRVIFEPVETVIEHYKEMESEINKDEQRAEFHESSALAITMVREDLPETLDRSALPLMTSDTSSHI
jgi:transcriptional regulator with XRE-family HTH domain